MKKYILKISTFGLPFIILWLLIFIVDPYNLFNLSAIIDNESKYKILNRSEESESRGQMLWHALEFKRNPCKNIIIGDSQSFLIKTDLIKNLSGNDYFNFNVSGANAETKFEIFWFATKMIKLNHVLIQLSYINMLADVNLFHYAKDYLDNPLLYFSDSKILIDTFQNLRHKLTGSYSKDESTYIFPFTIDGEKKVNVLLNKYVKYNFPIKQMEELKVIVNYCKMNDITIEFLIFPMHQIVYDYFALNDTNHLHNKFISELSSLGKAYDYSTYYNLNKKKNNFIDYLHPNQFITDSLTFLIWGKKNQNLELKQ